MTKVTGWDNGLSQDYDKGLGRWFANRLGARQQLRQDFEMTQLLIDRATLEQLVTALEAVLDDSKYANELTVTGGVYEGLQCKEALTAGRAALAGAERVEPDTQRLDFMFLYDAFLSRTKTDADTIAYQLLAQDEDEDYVVLSGEDKFFPTGRAAVDAAREKAKP